MKTHPLNALLCRLLWFFHLVLILKYLHLWTLARQATLFTVPCEAPVACEMFEVSVHHLNLWNNSGHVCPGPLYWSAALGGDLLLCPCAKCSWAFPACKFMSQSSTDYLKRSSIGIINASPLAYLFLALLLFLSHHLSSLLLQLFLGFWLHMQINRQNRYHHTTLTTARLICCWILLLLGVGCILCHYPSQKQCLHTSRIIKTRDSSTSLVLQLVQGYSSWRKRMAPIDPASTIEV